jgi:P4 family phage/plasmid primase-like protien
MIPAQLKKEGIRFLLVGKRQKIPQEQNWQEKNNYSYDNKKLNEHILSGGNYGVLCGNGLIVIDADEAELREMVEGKLPPTFTISTGKGVHYYFFCEGFEQKKVLKKGDKHLGEIQSTGTFVVGPGCTHPSGRQYEVLNPIMIQKIEKQKIEKAFSENYAQENNQRVSKELFVNGQGQGMRNESMFKIACSMKSKGLSPEETLALINSINEKNNPPLPISEIQNILKSAYSYQNGSQEIVPIGSIKVENHLENVEFFHRIKPFFYEKTKQFWFWNIKYSRWEEVDDVDLMNGIERSLGFNGQTIKNRVKSEYLESFKRVGRLHHPKEPKKTWVQFKNKVVDLQTGEEFDSNPDYWLCNPIPWELGDSEETPTMDRLFESWVGKDKIINLYEIIAYCTISDYPIHRWFCLLGTGCNGKGTFMNLITRFIGMNNICSSDLDYIGTNNFAAYDLYKKSVCFMGETNLNALKSTAMLKKLCGGDPIRFEKKGLMAQNGYNYAKIIVASNSLPATHDKTDGFYRRFFHIDFPNRFKGNKDVLADIPDQEYMNLARKCCIIAKNLLNNREFTNELSIEMKREMYENISNPIISYINEEFVQDMNGFVYQFEFKKKFQIWCLNRGHRPRQPTEVNQYMDNHYNPSKRDYPETDKSYRVWLGLRQKSQIEDYSSPISPISQGSSVSSIRKELTKDSGENGENGEDIPKPIKKEKLLELIDELLNKTDPIFIEDILKLAKEEGFDVLNVEEMITKCIKEGDLFEPKTGFIKRL